eukprot:TRINITY_DN5492_c0_g1_i4.p1 TRINITY_DN5492_c0_g1~~TRINITY_DN5492_c0_g1_i4.p1  ORF type:complete len:1103 (+),score=369.02 TRINITY_DN5492_c0_g1_i4:73-3381(+)
MPTPVRKVKNPTRPATEPRHPTPSRLHTPPPQIASSRLARRSSVGSSGTGRRRNSAPRTSGGSTAAAAAAAAQQPQPQQPTTDRHPTLERSQTWTPSGLVPFGGAVPTRSASMHRYNMSSSRGSPTSSRLRRPGTPPPTRADRDPHTPVSVSGRAEEAERRLKELTDELRRVQRERDEAVSERDGLRAQTSACMMAEADAAGCDVDAATPEVGSPDIQLRARDRELAHARRQLGVALADRRRLEREIQSARDEPTPPATRVDPADLERALGAERHLRTQLERCSEGIEAAVADAERCRAAAAEAVPELERRCRAAAEAEEGAERSAAEALVAADGAAQALARCRTANVETAVSSAEMVSRWRLAADAASDLALDTARAWSVAAAVADVAASEQVSRSRVAAASAEALASVVASFGRPPPRRSEAEEGLRRQLDSILHSLAISRAQCEMTETDNRRLRAAEERAVRRADAEAAAAAAVRKELDEAAATERDGRLAHDLSALLGGASAAAGDPQRIEDEMVKVCGLLSEQRRACADLTQQLGHERARAAALSRKAEAAQRDLEVLRRESDIMRDTLVLPLHHTQSPHPTAHSTPYCHADVDSDQMRCSLSPDPCPQDGFSPLGVSVSDIASPVPPPPGSDCEPSGDMSALGNSSAGSTCSEIRSALATPLRTPLTSGVGFAVPESVEGLKAVLTAREAECSMLARRLGDARRDREAEGRLAVVAAEAEARADAVAGAMARASSLAGRTASAAAGEMRGLLRAAAEERYRLDSDLAAATARASAAAADAARAQGELAEVREQLRRERATADADREDRRRQREQAAAADAEAVERREGMLIEAASMRVELAQARATAERLEAEAARTAAALDEARRVAGESRDAAAASARALAAAREAAAVLEEDARRNEAASAKAIAARDKELAEARQRADAAERRDDCDASAVRDQCVADLAMAEATHRVRAAEESEFALRGSVAKLEAEASVLRRRNGELSRALRLRTDSVSDISVQSAPTAKGHGLPPPGPGGWRSPRLAQLLGETETRSMNTSHSRKSAGHASCGSPPTQPAGSPTATGWRRLSGGGTPPRAPLTTPSHTPARSPTAAERQ